MEAWKITGTESCYGRECAVIEGVSNDYGARWNITHFTIKVDIVTGTWLFFEGYNDEGTVNAYLYTENLTFSDTENSYPTIMPEEIRLKINEGYTITSESEKRLIQWETEQNIQPTADIMTEEVLYRAPESMPEPFAKGTEIPFAY